MFKKKPKFDSFLQAIESLLDKEDMSKLNALIDAEKKVPPKIAVIGKSGVGKSTTIRNLFNADLTVSHSVAGTKKVFLKEFELAGGGSLNVYDMPGLGEDLESDREYERMYNEVLPTVDVVLYVLQANERALGEDQRILRDVVIKNMGSIKGKIIIGLNMVDKLDKSFDGSILLWDDKLNYPTREGEVVIEKKCNDIVNKLSTSIDIARENIVYYSAIKRYRLFDLLESMIKAASDVGWKLPINPKNPFELADPEVQEFVKSLKSNNNS